MDNLNNVLLEGNITRDPELKYTQGGTAVGTFSVAVNRRIKKGEQWVDEVSFVDVTCWSKLAEVVGQYLKKGRGVRVVGRLKQDRWKAQDGSARSKLIVVADHVEFAPPKKDGVGANHPAGGEVKQEEVAAEDTVTEEETF